MTVKFCDLQRKELVNVKDGTKIGYVDDAIIDVDTASVKSLVVYVRYPDHWGGHHFSYCRPVAERSGTQKQVERIVWGIRISPPAILAGGRLAGGAI